MTLEAVKDLGLNKKEAERSKNMFALGVICWMYSRPLEPTVEWLEKKFAKKPAIAAREHRLPEGRPRVRRDRRARGVRGQARGAGSGTLSAHHRQPGPGLRTDRGERSVEDSDVPRARIRSLRRPTSFTSYPVTRTSVSARVQAEDEIAAISMAIGAVVLRPPRGDDDVGAGPRPQVGGSRSGALARAAADRRRHPARRSLDRTPDEDRAVGPPPRDVRAAR